MTGAEVDTVDIPENADVTAESDESTVESEQSTVDSGADVSTVDSEQRAVAEEHPAVADESTVDSAPEEPAVGPEEDMPAEPASAEADPADINESTVDSAEDVAEESTVDDSAPTLDLVDPDRLKAAVEAVLLVVDQPIDVTTLAQTLNVPKPDVQSALESLRTEYDEGNRGIDLRELAGGWRLYSRDDYAAYVERFVLDGQQTRLTQAALETLAVIAYRQPVTRARVSAVRGVGVDAVMRTLTTRGLIEECGTDAETGGGLYRTTPLFLEKLGMTSIEDLPPLAPLLPDHTELDQTITDE